MIGTGTWLEALRIDPIDYLSSSENEALRFFTRRDLLGRSGGGIPSTNALWNMAGVLRLVVIRQQDGSWRYPNLVVCRERPFENYSCHETYRSFGFLVRNYGLCKDRQAVSKAADYLFSLETEEGDPRGIYGDQYPPSATSTTRHHWSLTAAPRQAETLPRAIRKPKEPMRSIEL